METTINQRIKKVLKTLNLTENSVATRLGISQTTLNSALNSTKDNVSSKIVAALKRNFEEINVNWLLTGEGEMLNPATKTEQNVVRVEENPLDVAFHMVPLIPIEALAGSLTGLSESVTLSQCRRIPCSIPDADMAIPVSGNSMEPEIASGSLLFIKRINEAAFIPYGHILVVDTENGVVVKKIYPSKNSPSHLTARSINPDYPPFEIEKSCIYGIYRVLGGSFINTTI